MKQVDGVTSQGFQQIFTTNLFGHFILVGMGERVSQCTHLMQVSDYILLL